MDFFAMTERPHGGANGEDSEDLDAMMMIIFFFFFF